MPIQQQDELDLPIDVEEEMDLPLDLPVPAKKAPVQVENMQRGHAAAVKADIEGMSVFEAFEALPDDVDPKVLLESLSYKRSDVERELIADYFNNNRANTPQALANDLEVYDEMLRENEEARTSSEKQVVESLSGLDADLPTKEQVESEILLVNTINDLVSDYSGWEKAIDIGKTFFGIPALLDNKQISGEFFGGDTFVRDMVIGLKQMKRTDPETFNKVLPQLAVNLQEDLPKSKVLSILAGIADVRGEETVAGFSDIEAALGVLDIASFGAFLAVKLGNLVKTLNAIKTAKRLRNTEVAADVNTAALVDETGEVASKAGVDDFTLYNNSSPFNVTDLDASYAEGLSTATVSRIKRIKEDQRKVANILRSDDKVLRESILSPAERRAAEEKFVAEMETNGIENVRVSKQTRDFTEFEYDMVDPDTGNTITTSKKMPLKFSDKTETWSKSEQGIMASWVKSPTAWAKNQIEDVRSAIRMDSTSATVGVLLKDLQRQALAPLLGKKGFKAFKPGTRRQMAEIDEILRAGDEWTDVNGVRGKVYTADELRGGVVNGVKLNDKQIEVYYNLRGLYDELWTIRNDETRRILTAQGKGEVNLPTGPQIGNTFEKQGAVGLLNSEGTSTVYNAATDSIVHLNSTDVARLYDDGYRLSRLDQPAKVFDDSDELFDLVVTTSDNTGDLPGKVLHYRPGYVPKVNKNAYYFVKEIGPRTVNGKVKVNQDLKTVRFFSSKKEADDWVAQQPNNDKLKVRADRELESRIVGSSGMGSGGGLYTGPRSSEKIPFGTEGLPAERLNTYEALSQNLQSLENYVSRNAWRMAMQQKWLNSVKAAGLDEGGEITRAGFKPELIPDGTNQGRALKKMGEQIRIWSGFPTKGELAWDGAVSGMMEWALNKPFLPKKAVIRSSNYLRNAGDPITKMRGLAFHTLLGWFNPAQLWVQAQGAAIAASMVTRLDDPLAAAKVFKNQTALSFATRFSDDPDSIAHVAKIFALPKEEMAKMVQLWKKTGLEDSILNTADHTAALRGYGMTQDALRRISEKGLLFYRAGELFNRRFSFLSALERKRRELGHINLTDTQLKEVLSEANNFMLNLSKANRANWQRGPLALPTQFLQVQTKFIEEVILGVGKSFTAGERMKIIAGQLALYGAAGVPLGNLALRWAQESLGMSRADLENMDEKTVKFINGGFWDWYVYTMLGADVDMASRGAISDGITEFYTDLIFSESSVGEKISGAFGTVPHRFFNSIKTIKPIMAGALFHGAEPTGEELMQAFSSMASITSTWNNAQKGAVMNRLHQLQDSRGRVVIAGKDFDPVEEVMVMLGFQHSEFARVRERDLLVRGAKEYRAQTTQWLIDNYWLYTRAYKGADSEAERDRVIKNFEISNRVIYKTLRNEQEVQQVQEALQRRLSETTDEKTRSIKQFIEEYYDNQVLEAGGAIGALQSNGIIQNDLDHIEIEDSQ